MAVIDQFQPLDRERDLKLHPTHVIGHYGVFSGRRWAGQICPLVRNTILANE